MTGKVFARDDALLMVHPQQGRRVLGDGSGGQEGGIVYGPAQWDVPRKVAPWPKGVERPGFLSPLSAMTPLDKFVRATLRRIEKQYKVPGWVVEYQKLYHVPDTHPLAKKRKAVQSICISFTSGGGYGNDSLCGRPIYDDRPLCAMHASHADRAAQRRQREAEAKVQRNEAEDRRRKLTEDLRDLWGQVCDERDIVHRGEKPYVWSNGDARVDNEVLMMLLRELLG